MKKGVIITSIILVVLILFFYFNGCGQKGVIRDLKAELQKDGDIASVACGFPVKKLSNPEVQITEIHYGGDPSTVTAIISGNPVALNITNTQVCHATLKMEWEMAHRSSPGSYSGSVAVFKNAKKIGN